MVSFFSIDHDRRRFALIPFACSLGQTAPSFEIRCVRRARLTEARGGRGYSCVKARE